MEKEKELDFDCTHCEHYFGFVSGEKHCSQKEKELTELKPCLDFKMRQVQPKGIMERIERMKTEKAELTTRISKLLAFMESDKFNNIDDAEKRLLRQQYAGMETYLTSLTARLLREDMKRYEKEIQKLNLEAAEMLNAGKSEEEVTQIMCEKVKEIQRIGENQLNDLQSIVMSGMVYSEMCKK